MVKEKSIRILATWFYTGLSPKAPGTVGSLAALPFAALFLYYGSPVFLLLASLIIFLIGCWAASGYEKLAQEKDPSAVVIDEVAGQWLALVPASLDPISFLIGFLAFRFFDILKPWPISWADKKVKGGFGIMLDDMIAGGLAALVVWGVQQVIL